MNVNVIKTVSNILFVTVFFLLFIFLSSGSADSSLVKLEDQLNDLVYNASRSIVTIEAIKSITESQFADQRNETVQSIISSGVIIDTMGYILVAAQSVIKHDYLNIHFGNKVLSARLKGIDYNTGIALLKTESKVGVPVKMVTKHTCAGQMVVAVGNSYGVKASPSLGFCAGLRPDGTIQFSSKISSGTVGGGLFDLSGNLVGLITGGIGEDKWAEVGLAVPSQELQKVIPYLLKFGDRQAGYIGITSADIEFTPGIEITYPVQFARTTPEKSQVINKGIMITDVVHLSPAANAGLQKGDVLISMNGNPLSSALELRRIIRQYLPGSVIDLGYIRNNIPYIAPLQIGKVQYSYGFSFQMKSGLNKSELNSDSLLQEIEYLKKKLNSLESKLRGIKQ